MTGNRLKDLETVAREHILTVLRNNHGKIDGEGGIAAILGPVKKHKTYR